MLYEYRSDRREALTIMDGMFAAFVEAFRAMQLEVNVELVGDRPCKGEVDNSALTQKVIDIAAEFGLERYRRRLHRLQHSAFHGRAGRLPGHLQRHGSPHTR